MVMYKGMKKATKAEKAHLARVKELDCCVCTMGQRTTTEVHHILIGGKRAGHFYVLPLCHFHHEGVRTLKDHERLLWESTNAKLGVSREWPESKIVARRTA